jgi:hypothetical protein
VLLLLASSTGKAQSIGAGCFGAVLGWYAWFTTRQTVSHALRDIATFLGMIGAASLTKLFPDRLFGYYCIGLAVGFFACVVAIGSGKLDRS